MTKTHDEINEEKSLKPRPDLISPHATMGEALALSYGAQKHGDCTWRDKGTEQAKPETHLASLQRHLLEWQLNPDAREEGSDLPVLYHARAQLGIMIDLIENPP